MLGLTDVINQMNPTEIQRTFYPNTKEHIFSATHGTFIKIDHILGQKASFNRYKKINIAQCWIILGQLDTN